MNKIKFNNTEFEIENYSKNTYFNGEGITSNASCSINTSDITALHEMANTTITSLQIYHDQTLIYDLQNISARVESIGEYLGTDRMSINVNLVFDI